MTSAISDCSVEKCLGFLNIPEDQCGVDQSGDFCVGKAKIATMTINNGLAVKIKGDLVVFGKLLILSSDENDTVKKANFVCQDVFIFGSLEMRNTSFTCNNWWNGSYDKVLNTIKKANS